MGRIVLVSGSQAPDATSQGENSRNAIIADPGRK